jgi:hypothetical protein
MGNTLGSQPLLRQLLIPLAAAVLRGREVVTSKPGGATPTTQPCSAAWQLQPLGQQRHPHTPAAGCSCTAPAGSTGAHTKGSSRGMKPVLLCLLQW